MSYFEVKRKIKKGVISPIYTIVGTQTYIEKDIIDSIVAQILSPDELDMNMSIFDMKETPIDVAVEDALTLPFFSDRRVVIVKDAYFLTGQKMDADVDHNLDRLIEYVNGPVYETILIISVPYEKLDERKKVCKLLRKQGEFVDAANLDDKQLFQWIDEQCASYKVAITNEAKTKIVQLTGQNLLLLVNELQKLALSVGEGGTIEGEDVDRFIAKTIEQNIFDLINLLMKKRIDEALYLFAELLKRKEEPIVLVALLARQVRILYQVKQLSQIGYSQKQIATQLKLHPYVVKLSTEQARTFSDKQLLTLLNMLAEVDYEIKSGKKDKRLAVELALMKFYQTI